MGVRDLEIEKTNTESIEEEIASIIAKLEEENARLMEAVEVQEACEESLAQKEEQKRQILEECRSAEEELNATKNRSNSLKSELRVAKGELRGWQRDKEEAHKLTT